MKHHAFLACHPAVNLLYFVLVLTFSMFFLHPLCLAVSLCAALWCAAQLNGGTAVRPFRLHWALPARMKRRYAWNLRLRLDNASCTAKWRVGLNDAVVMAARVIGESETIELPLASAALNWSGDNVLTLTTDDTAASGIVIREVGLVMERPQSGTIMVLR